MKPILLLSLFLCFACTATAADRDERKTDRKSRTEKKEDDKDAKKEAPRNLFEVTVTGAKDETAENDVRTFLGSVEGAKFESSTKTDAGMVVILSTKTKISRGDVTKVLKDNKDLKVTEFKAVRPSRNKKDAATDPPAKDAPAKDAAPAKG